MTSVQSGIEKKYSIDHCRIMTFRASANSAVLRDELEADDILALREFHMYL